MIHINTEAKIISNISAAPNIFSMSVEAPAIAQEARPGQFLHVRCGSSTNPLLRRPFSINNINGESVKILYQVRGEGTRFMSSLEPDNMLDIIGPLGNGFTMPKEGSKCLIIAGGIGIAPMHFLINKLGQNNNSIDMLFGCLNKEQLSIIKNIQGLCDTVKVSTNDGSHGIKGYVTDIETGLNGYDVVYSCGPEPMLKVVSQKTAMSNVECQVSLERYMACGVGACLSCVCEVADDGSKNSVYSRVCVDGPVYDSRAVKW